ncbi:MAG: sigma-70 family RNA polymerase sigma factor [Polyangiaceae bacterium]
MSKEVDEVLRLAREVHASIAPTEATRERLADALRRRDEPALPSAEIAGDLYLAAACLTGDTVALDILERDQLRLVPQLIGRIESAPAAQAEIQQQLREHLLVARGERPAKLTDYVGRGRLTSWLRVVAVRLALDERRRHKPAAAISVDDAVSDDPELEYLKQRYKPEFQAAIQKALEALEPRDRTLLRMSLVDGLDIDAIGQVYEVHRATAARWLARAREALFKRTKATLEAELGLRPDEFHSLLRLVRSQLDLSVCRLLRESDDD